MTKRALLLDSITDADTAAEGRLAVSGSHGGLYAAAIASRAGLRAVILNDAGIGLNRAGVKGVEALADVGMAAAAVDAMSAEIGAARDMLENGIISHANTSALALGVAPGQTVGDALARLADAPTPKAMLAPVPEARWEEALGPHRILCVDSASLVQPQDSGRIIVTGSHGGLIGGDPARASKAAARLIAFNDAGRGKNDIGLSRLPALDAYGIGAVTLDCMSCEIGSAASALASGVISAANDTARAMGLDPGMALAEAIATLGPAAA
ncbi:hypothetical protein FLO80_13720 [Aquicoccus porphyridii]|uniref:Uncharacterized protein n=1 Tax=Aquicoccus porphyridii TaxID=1852029 RepID=A0A5A9Z6R7_9RHOB|nr:hypothetical protein [Aquicoccus porphyridii]KAA0912883.1 hypothetical protein FLO80_13720 [Aquicoccus porphyridii]RAI54375.1 hypothetical protein DOO74_09085 [Rhodobacteraceae bacterium AsT-22]